jgi:uncharacterized membrane protein AbrB (regulator of aidB expression)
MADLGDTSQANTAHKHKMTSWITVALITVASIVLGFAFVLRSIPLAVVGGVVLVAGIVLGITGGIMDDAE